jgi:hypothetical protein
VKHKKLLLADYCFPCDLPCVGYPLLGNPTKNALSRSGPEHARVRLITAVVVTVCNRCRAGHESCAGEFDELFLLKLAVVPDGTAALKVTVR